MIIREPCSCSPRPIGRNAARSSSVWSAGQTYPKPAVRLFREASCNQNLRSSTGTLFILSQIQIPDACLRDKNSVGLPSAQICISGKLTHIAKWLKKDHEVQKPQSRSFRWAVGAGRGAGGFPLDGPGTRANLRPFELRRLHRVWTTGGNFQHKLW